MTRLAPHPERRRLAVHGTVQGVGFRPFVYRLARQHGLGGWVRNTDGGVEIDVQGDPAALDRFTAALTAEPPPLARVETVRSVEIGAVDRRQAGGAFFRIRASGKSSDGSPPLPVGPDAATCGACLRELRDPDDRRYGYAFINCTDCGPRFTIIRSLPYDRARTTMAAFELCPACRAEYDDPGDRRFHAEPVACPRCGPRLTWLTRSPIGRIEAGGTGSDRSGTGGAGPHAPDPIVAAAETLRAGRIVALKGLGGYQLACDATNSAAVAHLRHRKAREAKPFAVMVEDLEGARRLCRVSDAEAVVLAGPKAPIVLLDRRDQAAETQAGGVAGGAGAVSGLAREVAPGLDTLGVMLPYTPLHHLLMDRVGRALVMTSGNRSGEPIAATEEEARDRLGGVADAFLTHDRPIASRYDDAVVRVDRGDAMVLRRGRGYAPAPVPLPLVSPTPGLAVGGQIKGAFCLVRGRHAFQSQHIGDLDDAATAAHFAETIALYRGLFDVEPAWVAHDLHPDYASTRLAEAFPDEVRRIAVQHHHAHAVSCLAEHGRQGPALAVCFDGAGYGPDGTVWGGELLLTYWRGYRRLARLRPLPMPGGDAAAREPWRMAAAALVETFGEDADETAARILARIPSRRREPVLAMAHRGLHAPLTSSAGRLFDAVAALAAVRDRNHYEGQAAMELEARLDPGEAAGYPLPLDEHGVWDSAELIAAVVQDVRCGVGAGIIAARFHNALAAGIAEACSRARESSGVRAVVLTGGCFQNRRLTERTRVSLEAEGFEVLTHRQLPPNDGGLALGQAAVAVAAIMDSGEEV